MDLKHITKQLKAYATVELSTDLSNLSANQKIIISELIAAGQYADDIFWRQSAHDAVEIRKRFQNQTGPIKKYIEINYGPYDRLDNHNRFIGSGPTKKPAGAGFYPEDLSREEFLTYIQSHPEQKNDLQSLYTVIEREGKLLKAIPYHQYYADQIDPITYHLHRAAELCKNQSLKTYLTERAKALDSDTYYRSDLAWMDLKDHRIDCIIGPIENYEDNLFNYKAAFESAVLIRDDSASHELKIYEQHLNTLERHLPIDNKYKRKSVGSGNILEIVNVIYFGGDFQAGVKTIAASLPNDEKVIIEKGAKKQLYKNILEAKYEHILKPIAAIIVEGDLCQYLSQADFISQILLHEISHTIGPSYVAGKNESVRHALRDRYAIIEECKADVLGIYSATYFNKVFNLSAENLLSRYITYIAGLFRSIRFGIEEAHGLANLIQLNFLLEKNVIRRIKQQNKHSLNMDNFQPVLSELARELLMIEVMGDYDQAGELIERYGHVDDKIKEDLENLIPIPRDLDLKFSLDW